MSNGIEALNAWVKTNADKFIHEKYGEDEIATLAIACGFDRQTVAQWQTTQKFRRINP